MAIVVSSEGRGGGSFSLGVFLGWAPKAQRTSATPGGSRETLCGAAVGSRDSPVLRPPGAASGCAPCRRSCECSRGEPGGGAGARSCYFRAPAFSRDEEPYRALSVPAATSALCARSRSAGSRCDYRSGGIIILNARRKELESPEGTPELEPLGPESPETHKFRPPLEPRV